MKNLSYWLMKARYRLKHNNKEIISDHFRKMGMKIGKRCNICCNIATTQPFLIEMGDNVTIAGDVLLLTHDNSISKPLPHTTDLFGKIVIGNNVFIGTRSLIMPGVYLADNVIVAAGSVVTKSFHMGGAIIGGNPAKIIGTVDKFVEKNRDKAFNLDLIPPEEQETKIGLSNKLIVRNEGK